MEVHTAEVIIQGFQSSNTSIPGTGLATDLNIPPYNSVKVWLHLQ